MPSATRVSTRIYSLQNNQIQTMYNPQLPYLIIPFSYDTRGNLTEDGDFTPGPRHSVQLRPRNRLIGIDAGLQPQASFMYDAAGHRLVKTADGMTTYYVRDQQGQVLSEYRKSSTPSTGPVWDRDYLYVAGRLVATAENDNPHPPTGLTPTNDAWNHQIIVGWKAPTDTDLSGWYDVYRTENGEQPARK